MELSHFARSRALPALVACLALAVLPATAAAAEGTGGSQSPKGGSPSQSNTKASVACKRLSQNQVRCTMTLKGGATISGHVTMKLARGTLVVALGQGTITRGKATLTMRLLHQMTPGSYTVTMVVTINVQMVIRVS